MTKWEYVELKITHNEVEMVDDELQASEDHKNDPYDYVKMMLDDGWELIARSGSLKNQFSVVLKRLIPES